MTDLRKVLLILSAILLTLCLVGCISVATPPNGGIDSTAQTEIETETAPDVQTTEPASEQVTEPVTEKPTESTEEVTTYSELHFPESGE